MAGPDRAAEVVTAISLSVKANPLVAIKYAIGTEGTKISVIEIKKKAIQLDFIRTKIKG